MTVTSTFLSSISTIAPVSTGTMEVTGTIGLDSVWKAHAATEVRSALASKLKRAARRQISEVRSGGSYLSQDDLRVHFGLGEATPSIMSESAGPMGILRNWAVSTPARL